MSQVIHGSLLTGDHVCEKKMSQVIHGSLLTGEHVVVLRAMQREAGTTAKRRAAGDGGGGRIGEGGCTFKREWRGGEAEKLSRGLCRRGR